jgi:hypothetical protein
MFHNSKLLSFVGMILAATALTMLFPQPAQAQARVIREKFDFPLDVTNLANESPCLTEDVHVFGTLRWHTVTVVDAKGGLHVKLHEVADLTAEGLSTGDRYSTQGPFVSVEYYFEDTSPREVFYHNLLQLVGPGRDGNLMMRDLFHLVVNANGVQTLELEKHEVLCH